MGLCKCPKKTVTTMFCYEHRVNVCQHCMVANHQSCVVQSYLNWLKDTEFDSTCTLCHDDLKNSECVRLLCYHLFHWDCLGKYFGSLPRTTAPAGYKCPICSSGIIPHPNLVSPVADELRKKLKSTIWGKEDLTSLSDSNENSKPTGETARAFYECETQSAGRPAFTLAKFPRKNVAVSRSERATHTRKVYLPQLYTIVEDSHSRKYVRRRQTLFSWSDLRCRKWQLLRITVAMVTVFGLMCAASVFLLPGGPSHDYEEGEFDRKIPPDYFVEW